VTILRGVIANSSQYSGLKETWQRLGRIDLTSKPVIISLIVAHTLTVFGFEIGRVGERPLFTIAIALMAEVLFWGTYLTLYALQIWLFRDSNSVLAKIFIIVFSNTVRTMSLEFALFEFGLLDELRIADRFLGDQTGILMLLIGIAYIQVVVFDLGTQELELDQAKQRLSENARASKSSAETADKLLRAKAQELLGGQLRAIAKYLKSAKAPAAERLTNEIQDLIDSRVRPLSVDLWRQLERIEDSSTSDSGLRKSRWPRKVAPASDFRPNVIIGLSGLNIFITAPGLSDWPLAWSFSLWMLTFPVLGFVLAKLYPKTVTHSTWLGASISGILGLIAWLPSILYLVSRSNDFPELSVLAFTSSSVIVFTSVAVAVWSSFKRERLEYLVQIENLNAERSRQLAIVDQAVWVARRNWSYLIHGTVQGALTVAISRVQLAGQVTPELVGQVLQDVERARAALDEPQSFSQSLDDVWPQIAQTWDGVCAVSHSTSAEAASLLATSSATSTCVAEIAKELVSNAFRHGKATEVDISISVDAPGDILITSTNNGASVKKTKNAGIGSEMFSELTSHWSWKNTPKGPRFTAVIPVAPNP